MTWQPVIGLEVHVQLKTKSKIFSSSPIEFGAKPNSQANSVDLALPGTLPFLNNEVVRLAIKLGLSTNSVINKRSVFARKHYFYPDLPKGYQISQNKFPIISGGHLNIEIDENTTKKINLTRAHLEEDAGKSVHYDDKEKSGIDLNRAGTALLEIVTEPDLRSAKEAVCFLKTLHNLVRYLDICDGNMQEGSFRCDANISVRLDEKHEFGTRVEIKNINSFKFVEQAIEYEIERQIDCIKHKEEIVQETRLFDSANKVTKSMRNKENAHDYRYFAEPDLPPLIITQESIDEIRNQMPELPWNKKVRFEEEYGLSSYDARILASDKDLATYFEDTRKNTKANEKMTANWICGELLAYLNKYNTSINSCPIPQKSLALLLDRIADKTISGKIAKTIFEELWHGNNTDNVDDIITKKGLSQISNSDELEKVITNVITNNPSQLADYKAGKDKLYGFFVGQIMKETSGRANPSMLNKLLKDILAKD